MKKVIFAIGSALAIILAACDKESDGLTLQRHDDNRMMDSMHVLMDRMEGMPKTNDPEIDFSEMMIMHHQGEINMGNVQIQEGGNDSLKRFSQKMIEAQQIEIAELTGILEMITVDNSVPAFSIEQMDHMMKMGQISDVQNHYPGPPL